MISVTADDTHHPWLQEPEMGLPGEICAFAQSLACWCGTFLPGLRVAEHGGDRWLSDAVMAAEVLETTPLGQALWGVHSSKRLGTEMMGCAFAGSSVTCSVLPQAVSQPVSFSSSPRIAVGFL